MELHLVDGSEMLGSLPAFERISFDADGVLIDSRPVLLTLLNDLLAEHYTVDDLGDRDFSEWVGDVGRLSADRADALQRALWSNTGAMLCAAPGPGAISLSRRIFHLGLDQHVITSRRPEMRTATLEWFGRWFPWLETAKIHIRDSLSASGSDFKIDMINVHDIHLHMEDDLAKATRIASETDARVILLRRSELMASQRSRGVAAQGRIWWARDLQMVEKAIFESADSWPKVRYGRD